MDNHLTTPIVFNQPIGIGQQTADAQQNVAKAIPCTVTALSGELVTVKFELNSNFTLPTITIPQAFSQWIRGATQVGDKGFAISSDYYLGSQSGQGTGTPNLYQRGNLGTLVFIPITTTTFSSRNLNAAFISGPQGVVVQDQAGNCIFTLTQNGISISIGGNNVITINSTGVVITFGGITTTFNSTGIVTTGSITSA
jgi:hypothetical protein